MLNKVLATVQCNRFRYSYCSSVSEKHKKILLVLKEINYIHSIQIYCRPMELDKFLMNDEYTFVGLAIEGDKSKLKVSGL